MGAIEPARAATILDRARLRSEKLRTIYDRWTESRGRNGAFACRDDFDPHTLREVLPHVVLVDVVEPDPEAVDGAPGLRFRLVGTAVEAQLGEKLTGTRLAWVPAARRAGTIYGAYLGCARDALPAYTYLQLGGAGGEGGTFERLMLPLSRGGTGVDLVLGVVLYSGLFAFRDL